MNVLIVDKVYGEPYTVHWKEVLEDRGHNVDAGQTLSDIINNDEDLSKYHIAIAHPILKDAQKLYDEIHKRKDFRIILNTGQLASMRVPELARLRESSQVYYIYVLDEESLIELIEKGW